MRTSLKRLGIALAAAVAVGATGVVGATVASGDGPQAQSAAKTVSVRDNFFRPRIASIGRGTTVTWRWRGRRRHDMRITSGRGRPRNCGARRSGSCTRRFRRRGTFRYLCTFHGGMRGRISVR